MLVVPALNESETVGALVTAGRELGEVVVVDDGSDDDTALAAGKSGARVVRHESNQGYDRALASGFAAAEEMGATVIVTMDADGQHHLDDVRAVSKAVVSGEVELALGVRPEPGRWSEAVFNFYVNSRFGVPDILCGVKGFSVSLYRRHRSLMDGRSIGTALALAGLREKALHVAVPVAIAPRRGSSRFGSGLRADRRILAALGSAIALDLRRSTTP